MAEKNTDVANNLLASVTRFVCISDNHDNYDFILPDGDILLHSGDFTRNATESEIEIFLNWLKTLTQYRLKVVIVEQLQKDKSLVSDYGIVYLQDQSYQDPLTGWKFYGSGKLSEQIKDPDEIRSHWSKIPLDTDILLTHGPPNSILDLSSGNHHLGCKELLKSVLTIVKPKLHVFGHVHAGYGQYQSDDESIKTLFINASLCDSRFRTAHLPIVIDLTKDE